VTGNSLTLQGTYKPREARINLLYSIGNIPFNSGENGGKANKWWTSGEMEE